MKSGDYWKENYYIKKKLRTLNECIDVYHVTYKTKQGEKNAMLFRLESEYVGTKTGTRAFRDLYRTLRENGQVNSLLDYSIEGEEQYLLVPAAQRTAKTSSVSTGMTSILNIPSGDTAALRTPADTAGTEKNAQKNHTNGKKAKKKNSGSRALRITAYVTGVLLFFCLIGAAIFYLTSRTVPDNSPVETEDVNQAQYVDMPSLLGLPVDEATELLSEYKLYYRVTYADSDTYAQNLVCAQAVEAGTRVERFSTVSITVSNGIPETETEKSTSQSSASDSDNSGGTADSSMQLKPVTEGSCVVPDLTDAWESGVADILKDAGLTLGETYYQKHDGTERGKVFFQNVKAGDSVAAGTAVDIWVSGQ